MSSLVESICTGIDRTVHAPIQQAPQRKLEPSLFGSYETAKPVEVVEGPNRTNKCLYCSPAAKCMLDEDTDGVWIAQCGIVHTHFASEDMSARTFAGDTTVDKDKRTHTSVITDDERRQLVHIVAEQIPGANAHVLWLANTRLNQCTVWLEFVRDERPGSFWLTPSEVKKARLALKAACTQWAKEGGDDAAFGSPVFWAIGLVMEMVAQRVAGYTMPTQEQCDLVSLEGLHAYFRAHKGQAMVTEESEFGATKARGKGTVGQAAVNEVKRRKARFDELGQGRQSKMATLSNLLIRSHVLPNPDPTAPEEEEWLGLSAVVTALQKPVLMVRAPWDKRGGAPHLILVKKVHNTPDAVITAEKAALRRKAVAASKAEAAAKVEAEAAATNAEAAAAAVDDGSDSDAEMMAELRAEATPAPEVKDEAEAPLPLAPVVPLAPAPAAEDDSPVSDEDIPEAFGLDEDEESIWEDVVTSAYSEEDEKRRMEAAEAAAAAAAPVDVTPSRCVPVKRKSLKGPLKKAGYLAVLRSSQFHQDDAKSNAFFRRWQKESKEWRIAQETKLSNRKNAAQLKARAKAKREADKLARAEAEVNRHAERLECRGWNQLMRQGAEQERQENRSRGGVFIEPSDEVVDKKSNFIPPIRLVQAPIKIKVTAKRKAEAMEMLKEAEEVDYWLPCSMCNIMRQLPSGSLKPKRNAWMECEQVGEQCGKKKRQRA